MEYILSVSILANLILAFIVYKQNNALYQYESFFIKFSDRIKDFTLFLNSILKMNIMYFDDTIFELVEKIKLMKRDLIEMIQENKILFDQIDMSEIEKDEDLDHTDEKEVLGVAKKYGGTRVNKQQQ